MRQEPKETRVLGDEGGNELERRKRGELWGDKSVEAGWVRGKSGSGETLLQGGNI